MLHLRMLYFPPFRLDLSNERLIRGEQQILLKPKVFAVLRYLVEHPGRLITKEELFQAIWGKTRVGDAVLRSYIRELRGVLGDRSKAPQFIETVHGRGFRFIATISSHPSAVSPQHNGRGAVQSSLLPLIPHLVGRESELAQLQDCLDKALRGERQIVFVCGEAGIGKTTLVNAFQTHTETHGKLWIGQGQCIEHYGVGEAYLPILDALGRLCRGAMGEECLALLRQHAPTWLSQMPTLLSTRARYEIQSKTQGATQERMLRELAEALEVLTVRSPLILILEDLHWSDYSTLDLLAFLARRQESARLLIIGTYRPEDIFDPQQVGSHPLIAVKNELLLHDLCVEVPLPFLTEAAIATYLEAQFPGIYPSADSAELVQLLYRRSEGNPLFLVTVLQDFMEQGVIQHGNGGWTQQTSGQDRTVQVPHSLSQLIAWQMGKLSTAEQQVLEAASAVGVDFPIAAVAAGMEREDIWTEELCANLARRARFLQPRGTVEWPNGRLTPQYGFVHALYQSVIYAQIGLGKKSQLHQRIGACIEDGYESQLEEVVVELAMHFERGQDFQRAVEYRQRAARNATARYAYCEALEHVVEGLSLLKRLPDSPARAQREFTLRQAQMGPLLALRGEASREVERACVQALELRQQTGTVSEQLELQLTLWAVRFSRGDIAQARARARHIAAMCQRVPESVYTVLSHFFQGETEFCSGTFSTAKAHFEQVLARYDPHSMKGTVMDLKAGSLCYLAYNAWFLGYPEQAQQHTRQAAAWAQQLAQPYDLMFAKIAAARVLHLTGEFSTAQTQAEGVIAVADEYRLSELVAIGRMQRGGALVAQGHKKEGIVEMTAGLTAFRKAGANLGVPVCLAMLAEGYAKVGKVEDGLKHLAEALAGATANGEGQYIAELYRLKGEMLFAQQRGKGKEQKAKLGTEAEACLYKALEVARQQQAKSLELRAAMSLGRMLQQQGKRKEAQPLLNDVYGWFSEGFETADLQQAKALLVDLS